MLRQVMLVVVVVVVLIRVLDEILDSLAPLALAVTSHGLGFQRVDPRPPVIAIAPSAQQLVHFGAAGHLLVVVGSATVLRANRAIHQGQTSMPVQRSRKNIRTARRR